MKRFFKVSTLAVRVLCLALLTAPMAGCEMTCKADDNPIEEAADEIGDAVEDVADELDN